MTSSALDAQVGKQIFEKVIGLEGCLKDRTRILVTHKVSILSEVDQIVFMSNGQVLEVGNFDQLIENNGEFSKYISDYLTDQAKLDQEELDFLHKISYKLKSLKESSKGDFSCTSEKTTDSEMTGLLNEQKSNEVDENQGQLIRAEEVAYGSVKLIHHRKYYQTVSYWICLAIFLSFLVSNVFQVLGSLWLSDWSDDSLDPTLANDETERNRRITVYAVLGLFEILFSFCGTLGISLGTVKAAKIFHNKMLERVIRSPMSFFGMFGFGVESFKMVILFSNRHNPHGSNTEQIRARY